LSVGDEHAVLAPALTAHRALLNSPNTPAATRRVSTRATLCEATTKATKVRNTRKNHWFALSCVSGFRVFRGQRKPDVTYCAKLAYPGSMARWFEGSRVRGFGCSIVDSSVVRWPLFSGSPPARERWEWCDL